MVKYRSRRAVLTHTSVAIGTGLTGCIGQISDANPEEMNNTSNRPDDIQNQHNSTVCRESNPTASESPEPGFQKVAIESEPPPVEENVCWSIKVTSQFTSDSPAEVEAIFKNVASKSREFELPLAPPFLPSKIAAKHESADEWVNWVPREEHRYVQSHGVLIPDSPISGCWKAMATNSTNIRDIGLHVKSIPSTPTLSPGEAIAEQYALTSHPINDECLKSGVYPVESFWSCPEEDTSGTWEAKLIIEQH